MQNSLFNYADSLSPLPASTVNNAGGVVESSQFKCAEDAGLIFNTAFVRSRAQNPARDLSQELAELAKQPAYAVIMEAAQKLAQKEGISEIDAAEQMIHIFRKMDDVWKAYLIQEGMAQLTS